MQNNYQKEVSELLSNSDDIHLIAGLAAECGEVCGVYQKASYKKQELDKNALYLELGDVLFYVAAIAGSFGWTLEEIQEANIEKLKERHKK